MAGDVPRDDKTVEEPSEDSGDTTLTEVDDGGPLIMPRGSGAFAENEPLYGAGLGHGSVDEGLPAIDEPLGDATEAASPRARKAKFLPVDTKLKTAIYQQKSPAEKRVDQVHGVADQLLAQLEEPEKEASERYETIEPDAIEAVEDLDALAVAPTVEAADPVAPTVAPAEEMATIDTGWAPPPPAPPAEPAPPAAAPVARRGVGASLLSPVRRLIRWLRGAPPDRAPGSLATPGTQTYTEAGRIVDRRRWKQGKVTPGDKSGS